MPCGGVVHSFDGTETELAEVLKIDKLSIGINVRPVLSRQDSLHRGMGGTINGPLSSD